MRGLLPFLQEGLWGCARRREGRRDEVAHRSLDERARRFEPAFDVARANDRFVQARGEPGPRAAAGLFLTASQTRALRQSEFSSHLGERGRRHERGPKRGELSLGGIWKTPVEVLADDEIDYRVAEEL